MTGGAQNVTSDIAPELSLALNREGHHIRETIVEEARALLGEAGLDERQDGAEPIPESQEEINKQADAALRDLFPRIPHTDRQAIIERSFRKVRAQNSTFRPDERTEFQQIFTLCLGSYDGR